MIDEPNEEPSEEEILNILDIQAEPEIECAHCGAIPDGQIKIESNLERFNGREHRLCNDCIQELLEWL